MCLHNSETHSYGMGRTSCWVPGMATLSPIHVNVKRARIPLNTDSMSHPVPAN